MGIWECSRIPPEKSVLVWLEDRECVILTLTYLSTG
nr:MAG TPA: hypothetical protein [Caudoviricetes sp.]